MTKIPAVVAVGRQGKRGRKQQREEQSRDGKTREDFGKS